MPKILLRCSHYVHMQTKVIDEARFKKKQVVTMPSVLYGNKVK